MKQTILLRTRYGCEKYIQFEGHPPYIDVALVPPFPTFINEETSGMVETLRQRRFALDGQTADGIYIFTEMLE